MTMYHEQQRQLQDRWDSRRLADRLEQVVVHERITLDDARFIESRDMFFLATCDSGGQPTCSYKGGDPGFVRVLDERTLVFPNYDGNGMYLSMGNVVAQPAVGMLFIDFEQQNRLRLEGTAAIDDTDELVASYPGAQFVVRVTATRVYPNCPRYIHRYRLVERSRFIPKAGTAAPIPDWKRANWACDVLPSGDPAALPTT